MVDAIDTVTAKIDLAVTAHALGIPIISSMGTGNKLDPTRLEVADIYKTSVCPLAKVMRRELKKRNVVIGGICAGVDLLDNAGILCDVKSTHSTDEDFVNDKNIITARANAYVDFAIEVAKKLELFADENDLQETIDFWKYFKRV